MGWFDDIVDAVSDAADAVGDAASDVGSAVSDVASTVADTAGEVASGASVGVGWLGGAVSTAIDTAATAVDTATFGGASSALDFLDDTVFDTVDYVTDGAIDIDYDNGAFSANIGIDDVAGIGIGIDGNGLSANAQLTPLASADASFGAAGLGAAGSAGIDWGPLPYVDGHLDMQPDGTISVGGHVQGTIPTPIGIVSGDVDGGFSRTPDGAYSTSLSVDGQLTYPSGSYVGGGFDVAHQEDADGNSMTALGVHGRAGEYGVGEVSAGVGYTHVEQDGVTYDSVQGSAQASGYGVSVGVDAGYQRVESDGNVIETANAGGYAQGYGVSVNGAVDYKGGTVDGHDFGVTTTTGSVSVDQDKLLALGRQLLGDSSDEGSGAGAGTGDGDGALPIDVGSLVGALGAGDTGQLLGTFGGDALGGFVDALDGTGAQDLLGKLVDDGNLGSLLGGDGGVVTSLLGKAASAGGLDDVLGRLDPGTTANLISTLARGGQSTVSDPVAMPATAVAIAPGDTVAATPMPGPAAGPDDDVLGTAAPTTALDDPQHSLPDTDMTASTPVDAMDQGATNDPMAGVTADPVAPADPVVTPIDAAPAVIDAPPIDAPAMDAPAPIDAAPQVEQPDVMAPATAPAPEPDPEPAPAPEPAPVDDFTQQIQAADQAEDSVGAMFDGLG